MSAMCSDGGQPQCPRCGEMEVWRNGKSRAGKQVYRCKHCERVFVLDPYLDGVVVELADRMLKLGWTVPVIAKIMKGYVSRRWLYNRKVSLCL